MVPLPLLLLLLLPLARLLLQAPGPCQPQVRRVLLLLLLLPLARLLLQQQLLLLGCRSGRRGLLRPAPHTQAEPDADTDCRSHLASAAAAAPG